MTAVVIVPSSPDWPIHFAAIRIAVLYAFAPTPVEVEHIGSTSVPDLAAKPVIDVLLGAASLAAIEEKIPALVSLGFEYVPKYERELPERRYFVRPAGRTMRVHLHAVQRGSTLWRDHLAFRDALRADATLRDEYQALKVSLAAAHANDKAAYTEAKGPFIRAVLAARTPTGANTSAMHSGRRPFHT